MNKLTRRMQEILAGNTVTWRMQALVRTNVASLLLLFLVFIVLVAVNIFGTQRLHRLQDFVETANQVQIETLLARREEKDFFARKDKDQLESNQKAATALAGTLEKLVGLTTDDALIQQINRAKGSILEYRDGMKKTGELLIQAGLDEESGLHGKMRVALHDAESRVPPDAFELWTAYLKMRRVETDFIQQGDPEYVEAHASDVKDAVAVAERLRASPEIVKAIADGFRAYGEAFAGFAQSALDANLEGAIAREAIRRTEPFVAKLLSDASESIDQGQRLLYVAETLASAVALLILALTGLLVYFIVTMISRSVTEPVNHLEATIARLQSGDESARTGMMQVDELGQLGRAFDGMVEQRLAIQREIETENEQLNDAVLNLLKAVAVLSRRDLTHKVPVTEDVTGPVADALNLLTTETAKVLRQVSDLSADVAVSSMQVQEKSQTVMAAAQEEQREVQATATSLTEAAEEMARMTDLARQANQSAEFVLRANEQAQQSVSSTVQGIKQTRETMRETEKRIKRLGERSQEISLAVNLINSIAERTHILALNAAMHAASAGESGRGFAVVADEVQRLAESSRQATQQIAGLVKNIQTDTSETVGTMNDAIEQVVSGSRLAEQAGSHMQESARTTAELVRSVQEIAQTSESQLKNNQQLLVRADAIRASTEKTSEHLLEQAGQAKNLVEYARGLVAAVRVFKLAD